MNNSDEFDAEDFARFCADPKRQALVKLILSEWDDDWTGDNHPVPPRTIEPHIDASGRRV